MNNKRGDTMKNPPYYLVIFNHIIYEIYTGQISVGDCLDSTRILGQRYGASQNTINTVIKKLTENGFISTQKGRPATIISNCGNQKKEIEQLCSQFYKIIDIYETFYLLFPSMAIDSIKNFNKSDMVELKNIIEQMDAKENSIFSFREQKNNFIDKLLSKSNLLIKEICRRSEEIIMIPSMSFNVSESINSFLIPINIKYMQQAKEIYEFIHQHEFEQAKQKISELYKQMKQSTISALLSAIQKKENLLPKKENPFIKSFYLYDFIISDIIDEIYMGNYKIGDFLPSIEFMCKKYQVSIPTVRTAYRILNELQIAATVNGKGTKITLFSQCNNSVYDSLKGKLNLTNFWEVLQFISITAQDIAYYAAQKMSHQDAQQIENKLRQLGYKNSFEKIYSDFILLNEIINYTQLDALNGIYIGLKKILITVIYLDTFFNPAFVCMQEKKYFYCLEALKELKKGNTEKFSEIFHKIFQENLNQTQIIISQFGWIVQ